MYTPARAGYNSSRKAGVEMTGLLEKAIAQVQQLSSEQQDAIAALILEELADEEKWERAFAQSQDALARLAEKVRSDIRTGNVTKAGFDEL
ncbi:MAG: hypothetical protein ACT4QE_17105 [Anaerolineales bacterium]